MPTHHRRIKPGTAQFLESYIRASRPPTRTRSYPPQPEFLSQPIASPALVSQVDIAPTILDYAGLDLGNIPGVQGRSLAPLLNGELQTHRDAVVIDFHSDDHPDLILRALRTPEWKLVSYAGRRWGELVNLVDDPDEFHNLYGLPEYTAVQNQIEGQLLNELISRADVLPPRLANA